MKGVRTRFYNMLDKEVQTGVELLNLDVSTDECTRVRKQTNECKQKIDSYIEKLSNQSDKLAQAIGDSDEELLQSIIMDDSTLSEKALSIYYKLHTFEDDLREREKLEREKVKEELETVENDNMQKFCDLQIKLQQEFFAQQQERNEQQLKLQQEFIEKQSRQTNNPPTSVRLPKLDVVSFSGNRLYWLEFWDSFRSAVHSNEKLAPVDKFNYLRGKLTGEARSAIAGLSLTNENYSVAIKILHERFGDTQEIIDVHYKRLLNLAPAKSTTESLRMFIDKAERHLRSLEVLSENVDQHVFVSMLRSKLPSDVLLQLELLKPQDKKWSVQSLRDILRQYIVSREKAERPKPVEISNQKATHKNQYPMGKPNNINGQLSDVRAQQTGAFMSSERKVTSTQSKKCRFCEKGHWSDECNKYKTVDERKKKIKGSCFRCLKDSHIAPECKSSKVCVYCGVKDVHHRSLCDKRYSKSVKKENVHLTQEVESESACEEVGLLSCAESVLMQTASTEVTGKKSDKSKMVRLLLDSGSHRTYISKDLAKRLDLEEETEQEINVITFGSDKSKVIKTKATTVKVKLKDGSYMSMTANIVPQISGVLHRNAVTSSDSVKLSKLAKDLQLADTIPTENDVGTLDLLIGNDYYLDIVQTEKIEVNPGLYLLSSKFGWILSGRTRAVNNHTEDGLNMLIMTYENKINDSDTSVELDSVLSTKPNLEDFWNLESIGVTDSHDTTDDDKAMAAFRATLIRGEDGRYQVTWPWRDDVSVSDLPENRGLAVGRLKSLVNRIQKQPELMEKYDSVIQDQLQKGVIEKVDRDTVDGVRHYIPHHVVIKPEKATTKLRVVYDASAKVNKEYKSLNECLYRGPVLLRDLCGMILRFRIPKIAMISDIEKAFLQVELQPTERDVTRFLWFKDFKNPVINDAHIQELRFCRVPFGVISSPFLLSATIESHLETYKTPLSSQLKENIYMDNVLSGSDNVQASIALYHEAKEIFSEARMNLREWMTNSEEVNSAIPESDLAKDDSVKVLGYTWESKSDTIAIQKSKVFSAELPHTKRNVLKQVASVYDPLGLLSPITMRGKVLLQSVWNKQLDWDDTLDETQTKEWLEIKSDLEQIDSVKIKRCVTVSKDNEDKQFMLVCFCDASNKAYATSIYLRQETKSTTKSDLVFSKSRLAPVKGMTIPRLELMGVLIGVRCVDYVKKELQLPLQKVIVMTDSQCVLQWISSAKVLPVFVRNRVNEIKNHENITFRYVNTKHNPSDTASRGCTLSKLLEDDMWWHGPDWLLAPENEWPEFESVSKEHSDQNEETKCEMKSETCDKNKADETKCDKEVKECEHTMMSQSVAREPPFGIDPNRYSAATKLIRLTAWCNRFVHRLKGCTNNSKSLTSEEIHDAEIQWLKHVQSDKFSEDIKSVNTTTPSNLVKQLDLFIDDSGLLRCGGRLGNADLNEASRYPILLPKNNTFTHLVVERVHKKLLHCGVSQTLSEIRNRFWIPQGRATVRSILSRCRVCRRFEGGAYKLPPMAPLPKTRVSQATPFSKVGLDYFGPMHTKEDKDSPVVKIWVCLFTCLVTRGVHLEIVSNMTAQSFLMCFRRFVATKGTPCEIISDNAQQFKLSHDVLKQVWGQTIQSEEVQSYMSGEGIRWTFIIELAPWMGGFYERMVGLVKRALRKTVGRRLLTLEQLTTLLKECEAVVNSRPLIYVGEDIKSSISITPRHFITLNPYTGIPEMDNDDEDPEYKPSENSADKLLRIWKKGEKMLEKFWQVWRNEYLLSLRERTQCKHKSPRIQSAVCPNVNDVVLIKDDVPRGQWKLGKLIKLNVSKDRKIRSAEILTSTGKVLKRPLNLLYPIEVSGDSK